MCGISVGRWKTIFIIEFGFWLGDLEENQEIRGLLWVQKNTRQFYDWVS